MRAYLLACWVSVTLMAPCVPLLAQQPSAVTGTVRTDAGDALQGVTVTETGTRNAVTTNSKGVFTITVGHLPASLTITYVGYQTRVVKGSGDLNIIMTASKSSMSDVVVVGYQSQRRRNVTAAVSSIKGEEIENVPEASFDVMLQGRLAGVSVQSMTGEPGAKPNIVIRGSTDMDYGDANGGNTGPLYVIDGVIYDVNNMQGAYSVSNPLSLIDPNDIESIDVLKDASASAIYGARGGNGVIIVRTKRARRSEKPQVSFSAYGGVTAQPNFKKVLTGAAERALKLELLNTEDGYSDLALGGIPQALTDSLNPVFNGDVDWQAMLIRKTAIVNNQDLSVAGYFAGNNAYRISLNHYSEQGVVKGYSLQRLSPDINLTLNPMRKLSVNADLRLSSEKHMHGAGQEGNPFLFTSWNFPTSLIQLTPAEVAEYSGQADVYDDDKILTLLGSVNATDTLARGLMITTNFGANNFHESYGYFSPTALNGVENIAYMNDASNPNWSWENYMTFSRDFAKHHLDLVGGYSAYEANQYYTAASAAGIQVSGIYTLQTVPPGANLQVSTSRMTKTTESYYARASYRFKDRYLATASFRRDASSIYSPNYRWGTFPAFSAGWIASDEDFFKPLNKTVNFLKLRASWGITGQDPGSWYAKYQALYNDASFLGATTGTLAGNASYIYLSGTPSTYNGTAVVSPFNYGDNYVNAGTKSSNSVRWEKYPQWDLGGDIELLNSRINLSVDWYQKDAKDKYLWQIPAEYTTGYMYYSGNYAGVRNTGLEFALSTRNLGPSSKIQWNSTFNISFNKNWVTQLPNGNRDLLFGQPWFRKALTLGSPLFAYKLWQVNGVYATNADVPTDPITGQKMTYFGTPMQAGDARIVDQNGDYNIDYEDQVTNGKSPLPKATGGFSNTVSYKGLSLTVFASFSYGNDILNGNLSDALNGSASYGSWGVNAGPASLGDALSNFWSKPGDQTTYPRLVYPSGGTSAVDPWNISRSYFLEKGGFIKIKTVTLGYNLPHSLTAKMGIKGLNVYGMAENLHIFKQAKDIPDPELYDPTTGSVNIIYPTGLKFTFGLRADLQ
ncbi:SusC/RagA family TonB-linked outer membrane protein [Dinghuibacter silviterrae]|uniref:TonB-linked SusC/RagA family outer membrane protein n=1 Tax=Dinghuibacter silviterrae TaxID=1539049 RepID=A0A4R8DGG0_9BACT|nr:SusC/RagA family TonB-linked outer membrane protein [Dinghuibacter silviterrae]TDW96050.1 TonB-linked SusC/RagA family outer membrane protein [Dinghuibacter silviterrae]